MRTQRCPIRECGAVVLLVPLQQGELAVDPQPLEVAVPTPEGYYRVETAYRPHWMTCVDVATRTRHRVRSR